MSNINIKLNIMAPPEGRFQRNMTVSDSITFGQLAERIEQEIINSTQLDAVQGITYENPGYILHKRLGAVGVGDGDTIAVRVK